MSIDSFAWLSKNGVNKIDTFGITLRYQLKGIKNE